MIKKLFLILFAVLLIASGCGKAAETTVSGDFFTSLVAEPEKYNGEKVTFTGYIYYGFEIAVIAEYMEPWDTALGTWRPGGIEIWISGALPEGLEAQLMTQPNDPTGYQAHYGKVQITGTIEYGARYGHMDVYQYKINVTDAKIIDWKPGE